jgi:hypothetical protein
VLGVMIVVALGLAAFSAGRSGSERPDWQQADRAAVSNVSLEAHSFAAAVPH